MNPQGDKELEGMMLALDLPEDTRVACVKTLRSRREKGYQYGGMSQTFIRGERGRLRNALLLHWWKRNATGNIIPEIDTILA